MPKDFGLDYEKAKRIVEKYGDGNPAKIDDLAEGIRDARERGMYDPTPEQRAARTIIAERILKNHERRKRAWTTPNTGEKPKDQR